MDPADDRIRELAASLPTLALRAVGEYAPIVDSLVAGRSRDVPEIERTRAQSVLMTVWRTCWQQGRSALDFLSQLLRGGLGALAFPP